MDQRGQLSANRGREGGFAGLAFLSHSQSIFVGKLLLLCCVTVFEDSGGGWKYIGRTFKRMPAAKKGTKESQDLPGFGLFLQSSAGGFLGVVVVVLLCDIMPVLV